MRNAISGGGVLGGTDDRRVGGGDFRGEVLREVRIRDQEHGVCVRNVDGFDGDIDRCDGLVTSERGVRLWVRTADCLPILMSDEVLGIIGILHAGWRGVLGGILKVGVKKFLEEYGSKARDLKVSIGPGIRGCCYEVSKDVASGFGYGVIERKGRIFLDLGEEMIGQALELGMDRGKILTRSYRCTACHGEYWSYRRDGKGAGRMLSWIFLER